MNYNIERDIQRLPNAPGVYYFKKGRQVLYAGKATSLRSRVKSYFAKNIFEARGAWIKQMTTLADRINFKQTDSVLEALILEAREIKKYQPPYNTREKDDKSFLYVVITDEDYPKVLTARGRGLLREEAGSRSYKPKVIFGPFPNGGELRSALKIIRRIFPFRVDCQPGSGKPCFDAQIGLCPGVCALPGRQGAMSKTEYRKLIRHLVLFFQGKKGQLLGRLEREMGAYAKAREFEKAGIMKKKIFSLGHIRDVAMIKKQPSDSRRIEAYDIAHISGKHSVGVVVVMENGRFNRNSYRKFRLRGKWSDKSHDSGNLMEILERRFRHPEWLLPNLIVVDGGQTQVNVACRVLRNNRLSIPVVGVIKDARHQAREILKSDGSRLFVAKAGPEFQAVVGANAEAHRFAIRYHRQLRDRIS